MSARRLLTRAAGLAVLVALALPSAALAMNNGRGFYGATNDKVVSNTGFILIAFFPILVFALSRLQSRLDKRKEARRKAEKAALTSSYLRGGW
jgi:preprotein translocase subunit SecG